MTTYKFWKVGLLFFLCLKLFIACERREVKIDIVWKDDQAIGLTIPKDAIDSDDQLQKEILVRLKGDSLIIGIFGNIIDQDENYLFHPLIPFTRGLTYEILDNNGLIGSVMIPLPDKAQASKIVNVYPTRDSLPSNTLKMYVKFSKPMVKGVSLSNIFLLNGNDTINNAFLDLDTELWNEDRTVLTLWFDPGRVKRDLQPNQLMGAPLQEGKVYTLMIDDNWKDVGGLPLQQKFTKSFTVINRDGDSPNIQNWKIQIPKAETKEAIHIEMFESLDYILLQSAIELLDGELNPVPMEVVVQQEETVIDLIPLENWKKQNYTLVVESRLEDLAGNNLVRPFERDLLTSGSVLQDSTFSRAIKIN